MLRRAKEPGAGAALLSGKTRIRDINEIFFGKVVALAMPVRHFNVRAFFFFLWNNAAKQIFKFIFYYTKQKKWIFE